MNYSVEHILKKCKNESMMAPIGWQDLGEDKALGCLWRCQRATLDMDWPITQVVGFLYTTDA